MRRAGSGKAILFLHGAGGWPAWLPFFERLSQRFALTVPEHPGFGGSDDPQWLRDVPDLAMYYLDLLDSAFASPVHVIGHSLGGWTAAEAAVRNTRRIASLTLIAPAGSYILPALGSAACACPWASRVARSLLLITNSIDSTATAGPNGRLGGANRGICAVQPITWG